MGLFSNKPRVSIDEFCHQFYDQYIFNGEIAGVDVTGTYWAAILRNESFKEVSETERPRFHQEMTALYFEVFALAWAHHHNYRDKMLIPQAVLTKEYLLERQEESLWEAIREYARTGAHAAGAVLKGGDRALRAKLVFQNSFRMDLANEWLEKGIDPEAVGYAINSLFTDEAWSNEVGAIMLADAVLERMNWSSTDERRFQLGAVAKGLYQGVRNELKTVRI